jgi:hypothetical protein
VKPFIEVEAFRAGDYGAKGKYTGEDLEAMCADYDPALHEAPVTVDHAHSGPAFGWVHALTRRGDVLVATLKNLSDEFADLVRAGAFKKRSVEIYRRFQPTERPYLRALSFLGACPPEVKGLADPCFAEDGEFEAFDFSEGAPERGEQTTSFEEPASGAGASSLAEAANATETQEEIARLGEENRRLEAEVAAMADGARRQAIADFCRKAMDEGRIVPAWERAGIVDFMMSLGDSLERGYRVGDSPLTPLEWFRSFLESLPALAPMGELARERIETNRTGEARLPLPGNGAPVSSSSVALHQRAIALAEAKPGMRYAEALMMAAGE